MTYLLVLKSNDTHLDRRIEFNLKNQSEPSKMLITPSSWRDVTRSVTKCRKFSRASSFQSGSLEPHRFRASSPIVKGRQLSPSQVRLAECFKCFGDFFVVFKFEKPQTVVVFQSGETLDFHLRIACSELKTSTFPIAGKRLLTNPTGGRSV